MTKEPNSHGARVMQNRTLPAVEGLGDPAPVAEVRKE